MGSISVSSQVSILFVSAFAEFLLKLVERLRYERLCIVFQIVICPFDHPILARKYDNGDAIVNTAICATAGNA